MRGEPTSKRWCVLMLGKKYIHDENDPEDLSAALDDAQHFADSVQAQEAARRIRLHHNPKGKISVHRVEIAKLMEL